MPDKILEILFDDCLGSLGQRVILARQEINLATKQEFSPSDIATSRAILDVVVSLDNLYASRPSLYRRMATLFKEADVSLISNPSHKGLKERNFLEDYVK